MQFCSEIKRDEFYIGKSLTSGKKIMCMLGNWKSLYIKHNTSNGNKVKYYVKKSEKLENHIDTCLTLHGY